MWLKYRAPFPAPPRLYPPAERGKAPPVRFGRSVEAKGAEPRWEIALLILDTGKEERSYFAPVRALAVEVARVRAVVENQRFLFWDRDCFR